MLVPLGQYTVTPKRLNPPCASGSLQMCPALLEPTPQLFMHHALLCCVVLCCLFVRRCWLHWVQTQQAVSSWSQTAPSPTTYPTLRTRKPWQRLWTWYRSQVRAVGQIAGPAGTFCTLLGGRILRSLLGRQEQCYPGCICQRSWAPLLLAAAVLAGACRRVIMVVVHAATVLSSHAAVPINPNLTPSCMHARNTPSGP